MSQELLNEVNRKWTIFLMNLTYLFEPLFSKTFSSKLQQLTSENLNPARNLNLGWLLTRKPKCALEIASVEQYTEIDRSRSMLVMKPPKLSTRPREKAGKAFFKDPMSSSSGPVMWKVIQDLNGTPDANTPNEAISHEGRTITDIKSKANIFIKHYTWVNKLNMSHPIAISTGNSGNVSKHHLLTMKDVLHFNWVNYYLPSKRWKVKE